MQKIAVWRTVGAAFAFVFGHPLRLLRLGGIWLALIALAWLWLVLSRHQPSLAMRNRPGLMFLLSIGWLLFVAWGTISLCVGLHRAVLAHESRSWFAALRFRRRERRFLGYTLQIVLAMGLPLFAGNYVLVDFVGAAVQSGSNLFLVLQWALLVQVMLLLLVWSYGSRLSLVFPALAVDETGDMLVRAWILSRSNWLRLYLGSLICSLPFILAERFAPLLLGPKVVLWGNFPVAGGISFQLAQGGEFHDAISFASFLLQICVEVAFYSYCYQRLAAADPAPGHALPQTAPAG